MAGAYPCAGASYREELSVSELPGGALPLIKLRRPISEPLSVSVTVAELAMSGQRRRNRPLAVFKFATHEP